MHQQSSMELRSSSALYDYLSEQQMVAIIMDPTSDRLIHGSICPRFVDPNKASEHESACTNET